MNKEQLTLKIAATEASIKRWQKRLTTASNKLVKLYGQQRRLETRLLAVERPMVGLDTGLKQVIPATVKALRKIKPNKVELIEAKADFVQALDEELEKASHGKPVDIAKLDDLAIPAELDRRIPANAEAMTAARKRDEAAARSAMPLSGKAALAKIRSKK